MQALSNTVTPAGVRVINYLDVKRLDSDDWEQVSYLICDSKSSPKRCLICDSN